MNLRKEIQCPVLLIPLMRPKQSRNKLPKLTASGKQTETHVPGQFLPVVGQALRGGKRGVSPPGRPTTSIPDHPPRSCIADFTLYSGVLSARDVESYFITAEIYFYYRAVTVWYT